MDHLTRRALVKLAAGSAVLPALMRSAAALDYPARPPVILVGYAAGGTADITARLIGQWLSQHLGQQFVIENKPGAGSNLAVERAARAQPDGYTLLLVSGANAMNVTLYKGLTFDLVRDITPVIGIIRLPLVLVVNPSFPAKSAAEFISYAKANPGKINMATVGVGSPQHIFGALLESMAGIDLKHVAYPGAPDAMIALLNGEADAFFGATTVMIEEIRSGKMRGLAVTTAERVPALPDIPAMADIVPGYQASDWLGIGASKDTPTSIIDLLNTTVEAGLSDPVLKERLTAQGSILGGAPADFGNLMSSEVEKWAKVIKSNNIRPE